MRPRTIAHGGNASHLPNSAATVFTPLTPQRLIDTRDGTVQLTSLQKKGAKPQTAKFFDGLFKLTQTKTTTDLTLNEPHVGDHLAVSLGDTFEILQVRHA